MASTLATYDGLRAMTPEQKQAGFSALCCPCGQMLRLHQEDHILTFGNETECRSCGRSVEVTSAVPMVEPGSVALMDVQSALSHTWYHSTNHSDWMKALLSNPVDQIPLVHIGTKTAAQDRAKQEGYEHMYAMRLKPDTTIHDQIAIDNNHWTPYVGGVRPFRMPADGLRYLNVWESPGSISMLVDPRVLEITNVVPLSPLQSFQAA